MKLLSKLFYTKEDYTLITMVNSIASPTATLVDKDFILKLSLHPNGIKQLFLPREFRIASAIANVLSGLSHTNKQDRLLALQSLQEESLYAVPLVCIDLRYNTARVLVKVMKELIKARGNIPKQLHLAHSFQRAARGNLYIVRTLLQEYHLLEMPESYNQLSFDHHVHDMYSKGEKNPSQVVLDAWIQGVKDICVIYYNHAPQDAVEELFQAGQILDITTHFGIEFHIPIYNTFAEIVWIPLPHAQQLSHIKTFFAQEEIQSLLREGEEQNKRIALFTDQLLERYNTTDRFELEERYDIETTPLSKEDYHNTLHKKQNTLQTLASYIYSTLYQNTKHTTLPCTLQDITLFVKTIASQEQDSPLASSGSFDATAIYSMIHNFHGLSPSSHICLHMSNISAIEFLIILWAAKGGITHIELFNLRGWLHNRQPEVATINALQYAINTKDIQDMKRLVRNMIQECSISDNPNKEEQLTTLHTLFNDIPTILQYYSDKSLEVRLGSDSSDEIEQEYAMGFVFQETIPSFSASTSDERLFGTIPIFAKLQKQYIYTQQYGVNSFWNTTFGRFIHSFPLLDKLGKKQSIKWGVEKNLYERVSEGQGIIIGTGKTSLHTVEEAKQYPHIRTDLNNTFLCYLKGTIAFIIAFLSFYLSQHNVFLQYFGGIAWLGITFIRLAIQTMYAVGFGYNCLRYTRNNLILPRIADLFLGTSIAVFIIEYVTRYLILKQFFNMDIVSNPLIVYAVISIISILVILGIGKIRGLPRDMILASTSRIVLAFPVALFYTWLFMALLSYFEITNMDSLTDASATLLAKCASETVVGILIAILLRSTFLQARIWDYTKTLKALFADIDKLEAIHADKEITFLLQQPAIFIAIIKKENPDIFTSLYINLLDLFYFWYYLPLARKAFQYRVKQLSPAHRKILLDLLDLLAYPEHIHALFNNTKEFEYYNNFLQLYDKKYTDFLQTMHHQIKTII